MEFEKDLFSPVQMEDKKDFVHLLDKAAAFHGHLCSGQIVGVRIALLGLRELGILDPLGVDQKKIIVFAEVARCFADAIMTVTGCRVGKRSFKIFDHGKAAATFFNMTSGRSIRVGLLTNLHNRPIILLPPFARASFFARLVQIAQ